MFEIEIMAHSFIGDVIARLDIGDDDKIEGFLEFYGSSGTWDDHLLRILQASGRSDITTRVQAVAWLQSTPRAEADAVIKDAWNAMLKLLSDLVNRFWSPADAQPPPAGAAHQTAQELFAAALDKTVARVEGGKIVLTRP